MTSGKRDERDGLKEDLDALKAHNANRESGAPFSRVPPAAPKAERG